MGIDNHAKEIREIKYMKQKKQAEKTWKQIKDGKLKTLPNCVEGLK